MLGLNALIALSTESLGSSTGGSLDMRSCRGPATTNDDCRDASPRVELADDEDNKGGEANNGCQSVVDEDKQNYKIKHNFAYQRCQSLPRKPLLELMSYLRQPHPPPPHHHTLAVILRSPYRGLTSPSLS
jgi:hypothetical protein